MCVFYSGITENIKAVAWRLHAAIVSHLSVLNMFGSEKLKKAKQKISQLFFSKICFALRVDFLLYTEIFLHYYTMILQRIGITVYGDAGLKPRPSISKSGAHTNGPPHLHIQILNIFFFIKKVKLK